MIRNVAVGLGLMEFPFDTVAGFWRWVDLCEAGGVDSLWQTDRIVSREPILECMSVMAALAGRTRRIKFGVNVLSLALRDPVLMAKQCATIDVLSEGRLLPAFGIGSPLAPGMAHLEPRHQDAGAARPTRGSKSSAGCGPKTRSILRACITAYGRLDQPETGAARPADVDRRIVRGGDPAYRAVWHRLASGRRDPREYRRRRRGNPRSRHCRRPTDRRRPLRRRDRVPLWPARRSRPRTAVRGLSPAHRARPHASISRSATPRRSLNGSPLIAAGGFQNSSCGRRRAAMPRYMAQTRRLIEEVLPLVAARWPKQKKRLAAE